MCSVTRSFTMAAEIDLAVFKDVPSTRRGRAQGVVSRGAQYGDHQIVKLCKTSGITVSMGSTGSCSDGASAESFSPIFKHEYLYRHAFANLAEPENGVRRYIAFYNERRRQGKTGYLGPNDFELSLSEVSQSA